MNIIQGFLKRIVPFSPKRTEVQYHYWSIDEYTRCDHIKYIVEYTIDDYDDFDEVEWNGLNINLGEIIDVGRDEYQFMQEFNGSMSSNAFVKGNAVELTCEYNNDTLFS